MKIQDVIKELQIRMPLVSDYFTDGFEITGATVSDEEKITFTTSNAHDLKAGDFVNVSGVKNGIDIYQYSVDGDFVTLEFQTDHGYNKDKYYQQKVTVINSTNSDGEYDLVDVPDGKRLVILLNSGSAPPYDYDTGMILVDDGFDGTYFVSSADTPTTFTVERSKDNFMKPMNAVSGGKMSTRIRISGAADMNRFNLIYTKQQNKKCWLVVTPPENRSSRDRNVTTDAISGASQYGAGSGPIDYKQFQIESISIYAVIPASEDIAGRLAADIAEDVRWQLYSSLCAAEVPTLAKDGEVYAIMPIRDGYFDYLTDDTTYTHVYEFERTVTMSGADVAKPRDPTAPFRGLELELLPCEHDKG